MKMQNRVIKELALLLPAYQFMVEGLERADIEDRDTKDYKLIEYICGQFTARLKIYIRLRNEVMSSWKSVTLEDEKHNTFLAGLALLTVHMELKNKVINIGMADTIMDLQDLAFEFFSVEDINKVAEWAEKLQRKLYG